MGYQTEYIIIISVYFCILGLSLWENKKLK